eukprot:CAMPEP_0172672406 /NCGR_PEP_ID=MMETSP1074-20121228/11526_1 /TAXON_ID=2916 /ORGANISM="Ceratium fusus, Strain PA161109" /LENGTH=332 /DNA_ID=CAMNT_0013489587 /DNA_START=31 /DNA_END=1026 /DNA_ORIENTATION=+
MALSEDLAADLSSTGCPVAAIGVLGKNVRDVAMKFDAGVRSLPHGQFRLELETWTSWLHGHIRELRQLLEEAQADAAKASIARDSPPIVQEVTGAWCNDEEEDETAREVAELRRVRRELRSIFGMLDCPPGTSTLQVDDLAEDGTSEQVVPLQDTETSIEKRADTACPSAADLNSHDVPEPPAAPSWEDLQAEEDRRKARREKKQQRRQQRHCEATGTMTADSETGNCSVQGLGDGSNSHSRPFPVHWLDEAMAVPISNSQSQRGLSGGFVHNSPSVPLPARLWPCSVEQQLWEVPRERTASWTRGKDIASRARERAEEVQRFERRDQQQRQ